MTSLLLALQAFGPLLITAGFSWLGVIYYVRWLDRRSNRRTFVLDFIPFASDIARAEEAVNSRLVTLRKEGIA